MPRNKNRSLTKVRILLTGGHAGSTAYAFIQKLKKSAKFSWKITWVGAESAVEGKDVLTFESEVFPKIGVGLVRIKTGRLQSRFTIWTIPSILKIPLGIFHALSILLRLKPKIVVSFGGYSAFPIVVWAALLKIPVVIHEQTLVYGRANKYSAFFATKITLARVESASYFPKEKIEIVGNPISEEMSYIKPKNTIGDPPVLLITAGSRGSVFLNDSFNEILEALLSEFYVIHQTGVFQYEKFIRRRSQLSDNLKARYEVYGFVKPWEWYKKVRKSDIIVGRSGANTVSEILVSKRPSILIPLPISFNNEQLKNANFAKEFGIARVLNQKDLTPKRLFNEIHKTKSNWVAIIGKVKNKISPDLAASSNLVSVVEKFVK